MKYICLGYYDEKKWGTMSESERSALIDECFAYDDVLRKNDHFVGGEALQGARNAITLRWANGKVSITDGPYTETKEQLGGILVLEAKDLKHAIQLMSNHPGVKAGPFEIRPTEDLTELIGESERRRSPSRHVQLPGLDTARPAGGLGGATRAQRWPIHGMGAAPRRIRRRRAVGVLLRFGDARQRRTASRLERIAIESLASCLWGSGSCHRQPRPPAFAGREGRLR